MTEPKAYRTTSGKVLVLSHIISLGKFTYFDVSGNEVRREQASRAQFSVRTVAGKTALGTRRCDGFKKLEDDYRELCALFGVPVPEHRDHVWVRPEETAFGRERLGSQHEECSRCGIQKYAERGESRCKSVV